MPIIDGDAACKHEPPDSHFRHISQQPLGAGDGRRKCTCLIAPDISGEMEHNVNALKNGCQIWAPSEVGSCHLDPIVPKSRGASERPRNPLAPVTSVLTAPPGRRCPRPSNLLRLWSASSPEFRHHPQQQHRSVEVVPKDLRRSPVLPKPLSRGR
jgi:hypothetical protein